MMSLYADAYNASFF